MGVGDGTVIGATQIYGTESPATAFNLVVLAEGFTAAQQTDFNTAAADLVTTLLATPPFGDPGNVFNVFRVNVESDDAGADDPIAADPPGTGAVVATYFDATFGAFGIRRLLVCDEALALSVAVAEVPEVSVTLVMVNSTIYGGSGGGVAVYSLGTDASEIAIHEMGHTAFGLADEYSVLLGGVEPAQDVHPGPEPTEPNVTVNDNPATVKWQALFTPGVDLPTMENPDCSTEDLTESPVVAGTVGLFEGADTYHCAAYRPEYNCKMRALLDPFCAVCASVIAAVLVPAAAVGLPYTQDWTAGNSTFTSMDVYNRPVDGPDAIYPEVFFAEGVTVTGALDELDWNGTYSDYQSLSLWLRGLGTLNGGGAGDYALSGFWNGYAGDASCTYTPTATSLAAITYAPLVWLISPGGLSLLAVYWDAVAELYEVERTTEDGYALNTFTGDGIVPTADTLLRVTVQWQCGTWNGSEHAADGFVRVFLNEGLVYEETGIALYLTFDSDPVDLIDGVAFGFQGFLGSLDEIVINEIEAVVTALTGSVVMGLTTTVTATHAIALGVDGATNVHSTTGMVKIFGDLDVTGELSVSGDLSALLDDLGT